MKRKTLTTAIVAGLTGVAGMVSVANAVNVNPDGLGEVLLYPYYSARGGNDTLLSVVNTTSASKAVKVRFLEAQNSLEVLDFNLYLSPFDVWTAAVSENDGVGQLTISDSSCTVPYFFGNRGEGETSVTQEFLTFLIDGDEDRTLSGYLEIIEMGTLADVEAPGAGAFRPASAVVHAPNPDEEDPVERVPADCQSLVNAWSTIEGQAGEWLPPAEGGEGKEYSFEAFPDSAPGGLFGSASILNVQEGTMFSYEPTALNGFAAGLLHEEPGDIVPNLTQGSLTSNVFAQDGSVDQDTWNTPIEAVNAVLMRETVLNEYVTSAFTAAQSEWVMTFPTKTFHVNQGTDADGDPIAPLKPFTSNFGGDGACEQVFFRLYDREEETVQPGSDFPLPSPRPPDAEEDEFELCYEAQVVRFGNDTPDVAEITKESSDVYVNVPTSVGADGWARFAFNPVTSEGEPADDASPIHYSDPISAGDNVGSVYYGLPVIGFWVSTFTNGQLQDEGGNSVLANYGATINHHGTRRIGPDPDGTAD